MCSTFQPAIVTKKNDWDRLVSGLLKLTLGTYREVGEGREEKMTMTESSSGVGEKT